MGGDESKLKAEIVDRIKTYPFQNEKEITQREFVKNMLSGINLTQLNAPVGPMLISSTHILKLLYDLLVKERRGTLSRNKALKGIEELYDDPKKAIQKSYQIIKGDRSYISKDLFVDFVMNCFDKGVQSILSEYSKVGSEFKICLNQWIQNNRPNVLIHAEKIFSDQVQSHESLWTEGDFRRWILSKRQWTIFIEIKGTVYNIPLNLLSLLGINVEAQ